MNRPVLMWFLPVLFLSAGCGNGDGVGLALGSLGGDSGGGSGGAAPGAFLYVTNSGSNNISGFRINTETGGLVVAPGSPVSTSPGPSAIALSSNGFVAYVANGGAKRVTAYGISPDGGLVPVSSSAANPNPVSVDQTPSALTISSERQFLYVANRDSATVTTFAIGTGGVLTLAAPTSGTTNPMSVLGSAPDSLALSHDGKFLYVGDSRANEITAFAIGASGLLTKIASAGANTNPLATGSTGLQGIAASPNASFLYAVHKISNHLVVFRIESSGLLTLVAASGGRPNPFLLSDTAPSRVLLSPDGRFLYSANGTGTITTFTIGGDGLLSFAPTSGGLGNPVSTGTSPVAMTLSPDGQYLYVASSGGRVWVYTVAASTGLLSPLNPLIGSSFPVGTNPSGMAALGFQ